MKSMIARAFGLSLAALLLSAPAAPAARAESPVYALEAGQQTSVFLDRTGVQISRPYLLADGLWKYEYGRSGSSLQLRVAGRAWYDFASQGNNDLSFRALNLTWQTSHSTLTVGYQEVAWGETFGVYISDLVNPRDYRDTLFNDLSWMRVPVASVNWQLFLGSTTIQAIFTPVPRNPILPQSGSSFDLVPAPLSNLPRGDLPAFDASQVARNAEYGLRIGQLFASGLDLGAYFLSHWNRSPVYELAATGPGLSVLPVQARVNSVGLTFSQAFGSFVFRGDGVVNLMEPIQDLQFGSAPRLTEVQAILGGDYALPSGWTLGLQNHVEQTSLEFLDWASLSATSPKFFRGRIESQLFVFQGLNNGDLWLQPRVICNIGSSWSFSIRADIVRGSLLTPTQGVLAPLAPTNRLFTWLAVKF